MIAHTDAAIQTFQLALFKNNCLLAQQTWQAFNGRCCMTWQPLLPRWITFTLFSIFVPRQCEDREPDNGQEFLSETCKYSTQTGLSFLNEISRSHTAQYFVNVNVCL